MRKWEKWVGLHMMDLGYRTRPNQLQLVVVFLLLRKLIYVGSSIIGVQGKVRQRWSDGM